MFLRMMIPLFYSYYIDLSSVSFSVDDDIEIVHNEARLNVRVNLTGSREVERFILFFTLFILF